LCLNHYGSAEFLSAAGDIDRVHFVHELAILFRFRDQIHRLRREINRRCTRNSDLRHQVGAIYITACDDVNPRAGIDETYLPQWRRIYSSLVVGVEGIETVVFSRHVNDIVYALARDRHVGHVQWLGIDLSIDSLGEQFAKLRLVHIDGREYGLAGVLAGAIVVVVLGDNRNLSECGAEHEESDKQGEVLQTRDYDISLSKNLNLESPGRGGGDSQIGIECR
jgi:hypothetical protein